MQHVTSTKGGVRHRSPEVRYNPGVGRKTPFDQGQNRSFRQGWPSFQSVFPISESSLRRNRTHFIDVRLKLMYRNIPQQRDHFGYGWLQLRILFGVQQTLSSEENQSLLTVGRCVLLPFKVLSEFVQYFCPHLLPFRVRPRSLLGSDEGL